MTCNDDFCELEPRLPKACKCGAEPMVKVNNLTAWILCPRCKRCVVAGSLREARREWEKGER